MTSKAFGLAQLGNDYDGATGDFTTTGTVTATAFAGDGSGLTGVGGVTSVTAGDGLTGGTITTSGTISHADTSSQASVDNSGATVIQDVTLDTYGHVTGLGSVTLTAADVGALAVGAKAADSELLDGVDSGSFVVSRGGLGDPADWNAITQPGIYTIAANPLTGANNPGGYPYGTLVVEADSARVVQTYTRHDGSNTTSTRNKFNASDWNAWATTLSSANYNSYALPISGGILTGVVNTRTSTVNTSHGSSTGTLEIMGNASGGAVFSLHRAGAYAVNIGLDTDNVFRIGGWSASANRLQMDMSGNLTMAGNVTAYSDIRLKENLEPISDALAKVQSLTGYTYTRIDSGERQTGVVAQDVQKVLPEAVNDTGEHLSVAYGNMVGLLIEAIKEQQKQIDELKARLEV